MHPKNGMHELVGQTRTNFSDDKHVKPWLQVWWILHEEHGVQAHVQAASLPPNPNFVMDFYGLSNFKTLGPWTRSRHMISNDSSNLDHHHASLRKRGASYWLETCLPEASQSWTGRCFLGCASSMRRSRTGIRVFIWCLETFWWHASSILVPSVFNPAVSLRSYTSNSHCQGAHMKKGLYITVSLTLSFNHDVNDVKHQTSWPPSFILSRGLTFRFQK